MNNLPLQPLVWHEQQGWFSTKSPLTEYQIAKQSDKYRVLYIKRSDQFAREATGFATIEEAKQWAWKHYNEKMRPYVKPMPTWIDASERLPEKHTYVLVMYHAHFDDEEIKEFDFCVARFGVSKFDVRDQHFYTRRKTKVTHWMPIPKLPSEADND